MIQTNVLLTQSNACIDELKHFSVNSKHSNTVQFAVLYLTANVNTSFKVQTTEL